MAKTKFVKMTFTGRRMVLAQQVLQDALVYMASKKAVATNPAEVAFYEKQAVDFQALVDLLTREATATAAGRTRVIRLSETQFGILSGCVNNRSLQDALAIGRLPEGSEREQLSAAHTEWQEFRDAIGEKDPRKYDTSQDAEEEEDAEEEQDVD